MAGSQSGKIKFKLSGFFQATGSGNEKTHLFQVRFEHNCKYMIRKALQANVGLGRKDPLPALSGKGRPPRKMCPGSPALQGGFLRGVNFCKAAQSQLLLSGKWSVWREKNKLALALHLDFFYPGSRKSPSEWAKDYRGEWN